MLPLTTNCSCRWYLLLFTSVQSLSHVWLFKTPWTSAGQASRPSPTPGAYSNSCPSSLWCHPTISSYVVPFFSHLQPFLLVPHHQPIWKLSTSWSNTLIPFPHTVIKNLFLNAIGEFRILKHKMTVLLAWYLAINTVFSFVGTLSQ